MDILFNSFIDYFISETIFQKNAAYVVLLKFLQELRLNLNSILELPIVNTKLIHLTIQHFILVAVPHYDLVR